MRTCKHMAATLTALRAGSDMPEEVPEPHYPQGTSHLVKDTDKNGSNSCWRREPFVAPRNVEKSSTSSRVSCETSSLQYSSKPVHSPVYATGRYTKQSIDNSCSRREPFLIAKNVENTSTSLLPSHDDSETSSSPPRPEPVQIPVYKTGNHSKPSCDNPHLCREPVLSEKNVEKTSTLPSPSHNHCETLSALFENECTHSNMDIKAMSSRSTQTHRLSPPLEHPQTASDPVRTQQRDQVQEDEEAP